VTELIISARIKVDCNLHAGKYLNMQLWKRL